MEKEQLQEDWVKLPELPKEKQDNIIYSERVVFSNVRESKLKKSMRKRQCFKCEGKIEKGETYMNHQFRYDYRIITVSFCNNCL